MMRKYEIDSFLTESTFKVRFLAFTPYFVRHNLEEEDKTMGLFKRKRRN